MSVLGKQGTLSRADFERRFEDTEQPVSFAPTLFDAQAIVAGLNDPTDTWSHRSETGLSESRLRVTYSAAMPPDRLVGYRADEDGGDDPGGEGARPDRAPSRRALLAAGAPTGRGSGRGAWPLRGGHRTEPRV